MNEPRVALAPGLEVTPNVRLVSPLGSGGMGAVWLADHTGLNTRVVVKFMLVGLDSSATARARFKREAEAASQVKSPHVVQTFDYGVTAEGLPFIVMEHLEGRDLGAELAAKGALDPATVVAIITQVARALSKAHAAGVLHRDIKPDNIFLCQSDTEDELFVKLLDFGIAKASVAEGTITLDGETKTGQVVGTPFYMSPEQVTAQKVIDLRSDLWSLGVVAFEALTGQRPYDGPSFGALAVKIATGVPPLPSESNPALPPAVDAWFAQACAREPSGRFGSARELSDKLRGAFEGIVSLPPIISGGMSDSGSRNASAASGAREKSPETPPQISLPPAGPISVDDDAHERPSFVLASTVNEVVSSSSSSSAGDRAGDRAALARSEGGASVAIGDGTNERAGARRGPPGKAIAAMLVILAGAVGIGVVAGWKGREHTTATSAGSAENAASSTNQSSLPSSVPSSSVSAVAVAADPTPPSSVAPSATGSALAVADAAAPAASPARSARVVASPPSTSGPRVLVAMPSASTSLTTSPPATHSAGVAPAASIKPIPTGDPLY